MKKVSSTEQEIILMFAVSDTVIGIAGDEIEKLFKPFSQVDSSFTRKFQGAGLGLAISRHLVELMDGEIWVESKKNKGSTFYFSIRFKQKETTSINLHLIKDALIMD